MFKLFKSSEEVKNKTENQTEPVESVESVFHGEILQDEKKESENISQENFNLVLKDLKEALDIQSELGEKNLNPEDVFRITGLKPEEIISYLENEEFAIQTSSKEIIEAIQESLITIEEEPAAKSWLRKVADSKTARAAFVALMLLAKTAPSVSAAEKSEVSHDLSEAKIEHSFSDNDKSKNSDTYQLSEADWNKVDAEKEPVNETVKAEGKNINRDSDAKPLESEVITGERFSQLEMVNYFATDSDFISEESAAKIQTDFEKFLAQITSENAERLIQSEFKLFGSSDERPTSNWHGSNEELTASRLKAVEKILSTTLANYQFENLPTDLANELRAKAFVQEMPFSETGPEAGVTYITDLVNPSTGENYTEAEAEKMKINSPDEYKKLLDDCRKINFKVEVISDEELEKINSQNNNFKIPIPEISKAEIEKTPKLNRLNGYQNVSLLFDNSPSIGDSYDYMAEVVANQDLKNLNLNFATFSNKLDKLQSFKSSKDVAEAIREIRFNGDNQEQALSAAQSALKKMPAGGKNAIFIMTDEPFQDASWQKITKLKELAAEKTAEVYFYYADDTKQAVRQISLADLEAGLEAELFKTFEPRVNLFAKTLENKINSLQKQKVAQLDRLEKMVARTLTPTAQKSYEAGQLKAQELTRAIESEQEQLNSLKADWQSSSLEKLFANNFLQEKFKDNPRFGSDSKEFNKISADNLGFEVSSLLASQQENDKETAKEIAAE